LNKLDVTVDKLGKFIPSFTVSEIWLIIGQIFAGDRGGRFTLTLSLGVTLCTYPDKLYLAGCRMTVLPDAGYRTIVSSFVWTKHRNVTDGRTDGETARGYYGGLDCEQCGRTRCKNETIGRQCANWCRFLT